MRQEPWLVIGPMPQPPHPTTGSRASCHQLPALIARMNQLAERLQHFQQRYRTQLSRTDQEWLYHTQQQVAFDLAKLTHLADTGGVAPDAPKPPEPLQQVEPIEQLVKQIIRLAQNTTAMVQTALLPQQRTGTQGLDATTRRIPPSAASSNRATVDAILIVLGKHDQLGAHKEAAARPASGEVSGNAANGIGHSQETLERVDDTA